MLKIDPKELVAMDGAEINDTFRTELAYAKHDNLLFREAIYRPGARLWLHRILADIVRQAALDCRTRHGCRFVLYDGLRTVEAQEAMHRTWRAQENPHWVAQKLLSVPGGGGHPRGMAVDIGLEDENGKLLDMGTPFDFLAEDASPQNNPAHRDYRNLSAEIICNRTILTNAMTEAAGKLGIPLLPLPQEWWDFRLMPEFYERYAPLRDCDLPPAMRLT